MERSYQFFVRVFCIASLLIVFKTAGAQDSVIYAPVGDTYVRSTSPDNTKNFGGDSSFNVRNSLSGYMQLGLLKFDLGGATALQNVVIDSAKLFLTMTYTQSAGGVVRILSMSDDNDGWDENTVTWSSGRPDTVQTIAAQPVATASTKLASKDGKRYGWNVTGQVISELTGNNGILSLAVFADYNQSINITFLSKESAIEGLRPQLVVYTHAADANCYDLNTQADMDNDKIDIQWKTDHEADIAYFNIEHTVNGAAFSLLSHIPAQGSSVSTVPYTFQHTGPAANTTHFYRIETVLKDSTHLYSVIDSVSYGSTEIAHQTEWTLTQVSSTAATKARLKNSLDMSDFNPVGLRAAANVPIVLNVQRISGTGLPQLIVGTYDRETVTTYNLTTGVNTINTTIGGDLYFRYSSGSPSDNNKVKVTFQSGYTPMPLYILGATTHQQWLNELSSDAASPNVTLIANRVFIVTSKEKAIQYKDANQDTLLTYMDEIMKHEDEISGLDGSTPVHTIAYGNKLMLLEKASGNPDATSYGRVRIPTGSISWILDPAYIQNSGGWGIFHEIGHHHQQTPWSWSTCVETTVNIYSIAAQRFFHPDAQGIGTGDWNSIMNYLALPQESKNFNDASVGNFMKLGLFVQLWLAYGDDFYHTLHKRTRDESPSPGTDAVEMRQMMLYACQISGRNLSRFFRNWGLNVNQSVYDELTALNLPDPETEPSTLREDWAVTITSVPDNYRLPADSDNLLITASANGPEGISKVEFYNGSTKLGETSQAPYAFNWSNIQPGSYTLTVKAIAKGGAEISSEEVHLVKEAISIASGASVLSGAPVQINTTVTGNTPITKVEFYANGTLIGTATTAPYNYSWSNVADGIYNLKAKAFYDGGSTDTSALVPVIVGGAFPVADAYVRDGGTNGTNFGEDASLVVKKDGSGFNRITYLKFDLHNFNGPLNAVTLKLNIASANSSVTSTNWELWQCANDAWSETGITWNNQPDNNTLIGTVPGKKSGIAEWDITDAVNTELAGDKVLTLAVIGTTVNGTSDVSFYSKESPDANVWPQLIVHNDIATPVKFSPLSVTKLASGIRLDWKTYTEVNAEKFVIEHSTDGTHFAVTGSIAAVGNSSVAHNYTFTHLQPATGINYYRVVGIDADGKSTFSKVAAVNYETNLANGWLLYPNPVQKGSNTTIKLPTYISGKVTVRLINTSGRVCLNQVTVNKGEAITVNTSTLSSGLYIVQLSDDKGKAVGNAAKILIQ